jgi:hypothetical protein
MDALGSSRQTSFGAAVFPRGKGKEKEKKRIGVSRLFEFF